MDGVPWPTITAAGGGWALFGLAMLGFITRRLFVSRGEHDTVVALYRERAEKAEDNVEKLLPIVAELTVVSKLRNRAVDAALAVTASGELDDAIDVLGDGGTP